MSGASISGPTGIRMDQDFADLLESSSQAQTPERRLLFGIIERAVRDLLGNQRHEATDATQWLFHTASLEVPFSFGWICAQLELAPGDIHRKVLLVQQAKAQG